MDDKEVCAVYNGEKIWYIDAVNLINVCTDNRVLYKSDEGLIPIWHENNNNPVLYDVETLARELMWDQEGVDCLTGELAKKGIMFELMDKSMFS